MDGIEITLIGGLFASQFFLYYRLGRIEQQIKDLNNNIAKGKIRRKR